MKSSKLLGYGVVGLGLVGALVFIVGLVMAVGAGVPAMGMLFLLLGLATLAGAFRLSRRYPVQSEISTDVRQSQWANGMALSPLALTVLGFVAGDMLWQVASGQAQGRTSLIGLYLMLAFASLGQMTWYWQYGWRRDELIRSYFSSALAWGFVIALGSLFVLMGLAIFSLQYAVTGLPVAVGLVLLATGVRLWWQVRQADNG